MKDLRSKKRMAFYLDLLVRMDVEAPADLHDELGRFDVVRRTKGLAWQRNFVVEVKI